ncbi:malonyl-CoA decarboxylase [Roseobacter sp. YSTF-M11]|uniref:Malonyl-CoA decarboxylase n=1 Tax=Roseobacter insulae TaxID=2859783 RepID=A0A9X1FY69_9RHOB|nr:malonyl-CoA decarboxylase [Roseobacter insulae]MBW4709822.1 malonyl-CoA decarboxylase [Roseobacter insulae]
MDALEGMDETALSDTFRTIAAEFGPDQAGLETAIHAFDAADPASARALHRASEPRTQELLRRLNQAPGGTRSLVRLRARLLKIAKSDPVLRALDGDFHHLFSSWFNRGFLDLRRIEWSTSAEVLERIIDYEAVHAIQDWHDLKSRVSSDDRRLYAFFHPALQDDPLIFVEVALSGEIPTSIDSILSPDRVVTRSKDATTAVFYSISNCQPGLKGVSFGNFLIKQVVEDLSRELPDIATFVTLSPVPRLRAWVRHQRINPSDEEMPRQVAETLQKLDPDQAKPTDDDALMLAAHYLVHAKTQKGQPLDPVARFHLGNGARLQAIHANADQSLRGQENAWGVMVNYLYDRRDIARNQEDFATTGEVKFGPSVRRLLR